MITVQFDSITATINDGVWKTDEDKKTEFLETALNLGLEFDIIIKEYGWVGEPDTDLLSAKKMVERFGGKITDKSKHTPPPTHTVEDAKLGIVY